MASRLEVQAILEAIPGVAKAYYQPPSGVTMIYPAIVYSKAKIKTIYAGNKLYGKRTQYNVTVIDHNPDNVIGAYLVDNFMATLAGNPYNVNYLYHEKYDIYF